MMTSGAHHPAEPFGLVRPNGSDDGTPTTHHVFFDGTPIATPFGPNVERPKSLASGTVPPAACLPPDPR